jgi:adenylylsulfate kinase
VRARIDKFVEVFVDCPIDACIDRDVKGLYRKALAGEIKEFTGVSDPYEAPLNPEITVHTDRETPAESAARIIAYLEQTGLLQSALDPVLVEG